MGVASSVSAEELLSLSVDNMLSEVPDWAPPFCFICSYESAFVLIFEIILFKMLLCLISLNLLVIHR